MADREMDPGDGGAAAITAGLLVVVLVVIGFFFFFSVDGSRAQVIDLDAAPAPAVTSPLGATATPVQLVETRR